MSHLTSVRILRYLWAGPGTVLGLAIAAAALVKGRVAIVDGVIEASGPPVAWLLHHLPVSGGVAAITLGHVVLGCDARTLADTRAHERVHVLQYERWGPLFLPAYAAASLWALVAGRHPYHDNPFEREAVRMAEAGGPAASAWRCRA